MSDPMAGHQPTSSPAAALPDLVKTTSAIPDNQSARSKRSSTDSGTIMANENANNTDSRADASKAALAELDAGADAATIEKTAGLDADDTERADAAAADAATVDAEGRPLPLTVDISGKTAPWNFDTDPANPYNWPMQRKWAQVACYAAVALATSIGTSIMSPAHADLMLAFGATSTEAILPLSCYVIALGVGPIVIGGPLSELIGRLPILLAGTPVGMLFIIGAARAPTSSLAGLCILRFLAGFALSPSLAIVSGVLTETFRPVERGLPVATFIMMPFLGPGMGPVFGAFAMRKGWRWTQWTLVFFLAFSLGLAVLLGRETYHPVIKRRRAKALGIALPPADLPPQVPWLLRLHAFVTVGLIRPLHMLVAEPIIGLSCLYVAAEFATLFSFFAAVPYVFQITYRFGREDSGLVFLAIVVGVFFGLVTVMLTDVFIYRRRQVPRFHPHPPPPEHRLYAAMIGSVGLPAGLFWFGWSAYHRAHWISPVIAIVPFAWGNMCIFISLMQYMGDTYPGAIVASGASANSLARYALAGAFPLFTLQMYEKLGINWASSLLGFVAVALLPVPWLFFRFGSRIRAHSRYL